MSAIPRPPKPPAGAEPVTSPEPPKSRLEQFQDKGIEPGLPYCEFPYLVEWLMEAGPVTTSEMGRSPLSWREIGAWAMEMGTDPQPWEKTLLRKMSAAFATETARAEDPEAPSPDTIEQGAIDRVGVAKAVRNALADWKSRA